MPQPIPLLREKLNPNWTFGVAVVLLLVLYGYTISTGLNTTSDSLYYLTAARSLQTVSQLLAPDGSPYRYWGPLYPVLLSVFSSSAAIIGLHGAALLGNLVLWSRLGSKLLPAGRAGVFPLALALSTAMLVPVRFVWSETVFAVLLAGYVCALLTWLRTNAACWLLVATVLGFLLPLQRTMGLFLLAGVGLGLLLTRQVRGRWGPLLGHGVVCAVGGLAWNAYAELAAGPPVYQQVGGWPKLLGSLADYGFVLLRWFVPVAARWRLEWASGYGVFLMLLLVALWPRATVSRPQGASPQQSLRVLWTMVVVYTVALLLAVNITRGAAGLHDTERYLAAVSGPVLLLVLAAWPTGATQRWRLMQKLLLVAWLAYSGVRIGQNASALHRRSSSFPLEVNWGTGRQVIK